jgi:tetratricopeptide (TPR) repeat protein
MEKEQAAGLLKKAYEKLKDSDPAAACDLMGQALDCDYGNEEIKHALKCVNWWLQHMGRVNEIKNPYEKGAFLISLLKQYFVFLGQLNQNFEQCQYSVRYFVYSKALFFFEGLLANPAYQHDFGLLLLTGRCYKGIGNYDEALRFIERAVHIKREDAETLAEAADINALLAQERAAKTLFREAFFIDPSKIDVRFLESALIQKLRENVSQMGFKDEELSEWIPVYGYLWGVFSVKRELKQTEAGRLKQSIFSMETEYESNPARRVILKPRLLNHYFWLIDYCEKSKEDTSLIEETLLKIKVKDPDIYSMYTR